MSERTETPRDIIVRTGDRVDQLLRAGELTLPPDYAWRNALQGAWLWLQEATVQSGPRKGEPILAVVTQPSVANALFEMIVQGLAIHRKQGYLIPYGQTLTFQPSVFGRIAQAKRVAGLREVVAELIREGDTFRYRIDRGRKVDIEHAQTFEALERAKIIGAYAWLDFGDPDRDRAEVMTIDDVEASWAKSKQAGYDSSPHKQFRGEMVKRTVVTRAVKALINSATDDPRLLAAINSWADQDEPEPEDLETIDVEATPEPERARLKAPPAGSESIVTETEPAAEPEQPPPFEPAPARRSPAPAAAKPAELFPDGPGF